MQVLLGFLLVFLISIILTGVVVIFKGRQTDKEVAQYKLDVQKRKEKEEWYKLDKEMQEGVSAIREITLQAQKQVLNHPKMKSNKVNYLELNERISNLNKQIVKGSFEIAKKATRL